MSDDAIYERLLREVETLRHRLEQVEAELRHRIAGPPQAPAAQPSPPTKGAPSPGAVPAAEAPGVVDMLGLGDDFRRVLTALLREGRTSAAALAAELGEDEAMVQALLQALVNQGYARRQDDASGPSLYLPVIKAKGPSRAGSGLWDRLGT